MLFIHTFEVQPFLKLGDIFLAPVEGCSLWLQRWGPSGPAKKNVEIFWGGNLFWEFFSPRNIFLGKLFSGNFFFLQFFFGNLFLGISFLEICFIKKIYS